MQQEELKPGRIYVGYWSEKERCIFKYTGDLNGKTYIIKAFGTEMEVSRTGCCTAANVFFREPNPSEFELLNSQLPGDEKIIIQPDYQIY